MSRFETTELSDPRFESGNLRFITVKSSNLSGRGDICVFVPEGNKRTDLPIAILLHGVYGSSWIWSQKAGVHHTAQQMIDKGEINPLILAMPSDGLWYDGSFYTTHDGYNFEKWIVEDVPYAVKELIPQAANSDKLFICGLSMGGFGALRIGAKYGDKFAAISAHSSITNINQQGLFIKENSPSISQNDQVEESVLHTMLQMRDKLPPFRFDCGKNDLLITHNRELSSELNKINIPHIYEEFEGGHQWSYWEEHIKDTLRFFNKYM